MPGGTMLCVLDDKDPFISYQEECILVLRDNDSVVISVNRGGDHSLWHRRHFPRDEAFSWFASTRTAVAQRPSSTGASAHGNLEGRSFTSQDHNSRSKIATLGRRMPTKPSSASSTEGSGNNSGGSKRTKDERPRSRGGYGASSTTKKAPSSTGFLGDIITGNVPNDDTTKK